MASRYDRTWKDPLGLWWGETVDPYEESNVNRSAIRPTYDQSGQLTWEELTRPDDYSAPARYTGAPGAYDFWPELLTAAGIGQDQYDWRGVGPGTEIPRSVLDQGMQQILSRPDIYAGVNDLGYKTLEDYLANPQSGIVQRDGKYYAAPENITDPLRTVGRSGWPLALQNFMMFLPFAGEVTGATSAISDALSGLSDTSAQAGNYLEYARDPNFTTNLSHVAEAGAGAPELTLDSLLADNPYLTGNEILAQSSSGFIDPFSQEFLSAATAAGGTPQYNPFESPESFSQERLAYEQSLDPTAQPDPNLTEHMNKYGGAPGKPWYSMPPAAGAAKVLSDVLGTDSPIDPGWVTAGATVAGGLLGAGLNAKTQGEKNEIAQQQVERQNQILGGIDQTFANPMDYMGKYDELAKYWSDILGRRWSMQTGNPANSPRAMLESSNFLTGTLFDQLNKDRSIMSNLYAASNPSGGYTTLINNTGGVNDAIGQGIGSILSVFGDPAQQKAQNNPLLFWSGKP